MYLAGVHVNMYTCTFRVGGKREGEEVIHDDGESSEALLRIVPPTDHTQESNGLHVAAGAHVHLKVFNAHRLRLCNSDLDVH